MRFISAVIELFRKDLRVERRSREMISAMLVFALLTVLIFVFAFEMNGSSQREAFAGSLWVALCFSGTLGLTRSFNVERENDALTALLLTPHDRSAFFFGKALANWFFMVLLAACLVPVGAFFFNLNPFHWALMAIILLGTLGYALAGTFLAAISSRLRSRELYLPILLFPLLVPLLLAAIRATNAMLAGAASTELNTWLLMLGGYDILFMALGIFLFDAVVSE